jgi:hypothetical protein
MLHYERKIERKVSLMRLLAVLLIAIGFFAFKWGYSNFGYFILVAFISLSVVVITDFSVSTESIVIKRYFIFGFYRLSWCFEDGSEIAANSFESDFGESSHSGNYPAAETNVGCVFSLFELFFPSKITRREFIISTKSDPSDKVKLLLNKEEYEFLRGFMQKGHRT